MPKGKTGSTSGYDHASHGDPWGRQPDESQPAYDAFITYRDQGYTRSYRATAAALNKSRSLIDRWGKVWFWQGRAAAWDAELAKQTAVKQREAQEKARKRHETIAVTFQSKAVERLRKLDVNELKPGDLIRWFEIAVRIEREALGMAGHTLGLQVSGDGYEAPDVGNLGAEETLARLRQLTAESARRLSDRGITAPAGYGPPEEPDEIEDAELVDEPADATA